MLPAVYVCPICNLQFTRRSDLRGHISRSHTLAEENGVDFGELPRVCPDCLQQFPTRRERDRHAYLTRHFGPHRFRCQYCYARFTNVEDLNEHVSTVHLHNYSITREAFRGRFVYLARSFSHHAVPSVAALARLQGATHHSLIHGYLFRFNAIKCQLAINCRFAKLSPEGAIEDVIVMPMMTPMQTLFAGMKRLIPKNLKMFYTHLAQNIRNVEIRGSNLVLIDIVGCSVKLCKATFAGGAGSKRRRVEMVSEREQKFTIDVETDIPHGCIYASIAQHFLNLEADDPSERESPECGGVFPRGSQRYLKTKHWLDQCGFQRIPNQVGPVDLDDIRKLEKWNKALFDIGINVYGKATREELEVYDGDLPKWLNKKEVLIVPLVVTRRTKAKNKISLLLTGNEKSPSSELHFVYIADLDGLMRLPSGFTCCMYCLGRVSKPFLEKHLSYCSQHGAQRVLLPQVGDGGEIPALAFRPGKKKFLSPVIAFIDFECGNKYLSEDMEDDEFDPARPSEDGNMTRGQVRQAQEFDNVVASESEILNKMSSGESWTSNVAEQLPLTYALVYVTGEQRVLEQIVRSSDSPEELLDMLVSDLVTNYERFRPYFNDMAFQMPKLTPEQKSLYDSAETCWICFKEFTDERGMDKVRDHCHDSFQYDKYGFLGAAHRKCNSSRQHATHIPTFIHNLGGFDGCFIVRAMVRHGERLKWRMTGMPRNSERFLGLTFGPYVIRDSVLALQGSLAGLTDQAVLDGYQFPILDHFKYGELDGKQHKEMLLRKGYFPYDVAVSCDMLRNMKEFPDLDTFYSMLTGKNIKRDEYEHAKRMFELCRCPHMLAYSEAYCLLDTFLLASCFAYRRQLCYEQYQLDLAQFVSAPHFAMTVLMQNVQTSPYQIELITDYDMMEFLERGVRGGVSFAALRHTSVSEPYDDNTLGVLLNLDCVNLYGHALKCNLPVGGFEWMTREELDHFDWRNFQDPESDTACFICCDLSYPEELHERDCSFPMAPHSYKVRRSMLSPFAKHFLKEMGKDRTKYDLEQEYVSQARLGGTFMDRKEYVVHSLALAFYCSMGMKIEAIHSGIKFRQAPWIRQYVETMTLKRKQARTTVEKNLYKGLVNFVSFCLRRRQHAPLFVFLSNELAQPLIGLRQVHRECAQEDARRLLHQLSADLQGHEPQLC